MKVGFITNISSPYKTLQIEEFSKVNDVSITVYYTEPNNKKIKWEEMNGSFKEVDLHQNKFLSKYNIIFNKNIKNIVKENDILMFTGYDQLSIIFASLICKVYKKPYIIVFDGISKYKVFNKEKKLKKLIKSFVIKNSSYILANGKISKLYLENKFNYPKEKIYNQYLSVDNKTIENLYKNKEKYRSKYRKKYNINDDDKVIVFSGRLIEKKNVGLIVKAISSLGKRNIKFLITGGGILEEEIRKISERLNVCTIITGFMNRQEELFKHYFAADLLVLPSTDEPWGLVVNEGMNAGLPIIVSDVCGCSLDLVKNGVNGFVVETNNLKELSEKIYYVFNNNKYNEMGNESLKIIKDWTFENSRNNFEKIIRSIDLENRNEV